MHAFADESYEAASQVYIVGAIIVDTPFLAPVRRSAVAVLQPGRNRVADPFHWKKERTQRRLDLLSSTILHHGLLAYSVTASNVGPKDQEAARAACLEALVLEVVIQGAVGLTLDKRSPANKVQADRQTLVSIIKTGKASSAFGYGFNQPSNEPCLWIADAVAGATHKELQGDPRYCQLLGAALHRIAA